MQSPYGYFRTEIIPRYEKMLKDQGWIQVHGLTPKGAPRAGGLEEEIFGHDPNLYTVAGFTPPEAPPTSQQPQAPAPTPEVGERALTSKDILT